MLKPKTIPGLTEPVSYQIRVRGQIDPHWSDWFDDFAITQIGDDSLLTGKVLDQAALHGIIAKIRDLGLTLIFIKALDFGNKTEQERRSTEE